MFIGLVPTANAETPVSVFVDGNELIEMCKTEAQICEAYIVGTADTYEMVALHLTNICRPKAVTVPQIGEVILKWLVEHPAERHRPAAKLAGLAMADAWPCVRQ